MSTGQRAARHGIVASRRWGNRRKGKKKKGRGGRYCPPAQVCPRPRFAPTGTNLQEQTQPPPSVFGHNDPRSGPLLNSGALRRTGPGRSSVEPARFRTGGQGDASKATLLQTKDWSFRKIGVSGSYIHCGEPGRDAPVRVGLAEPDEQPEDMNRAQHRIVSEWVTVSE